MTGTISEVVCSPDVLIASCLLDYACSVPDAR